MAISALSMQVNAGFWKEVGKAVDILNSVTGGTTATTSSTSSTGSSSNNAGFPEPTSAQITQIQNKLQTAKLTLTGNSAIAWAEASPMLQNFISTVACSDEYGMSNIGRYTTLNASQITSYYYFSGAMRSMQYHPKDTQCVSVTQIGNISAPALNALKFQVMFVSDVSGESSTRGYLITKQSDGSWLVDTR